MNNPPLVSIITITHNRCDLLPRAIRSILGQSYTNIEYVVVDCASTDETNKVVRAFQDTDSRVKYVFSDVNDIVGNIWLGFNNSHGEFVCFLDDDDEYRKEKIAKEVNLFSSLDDSYGMVYCWMSYIDSETKKVLKEHQPSLRGFVGDEVVERPIVSGTPTYLIRSEVFRELGGWNSNIGIISDWELSCRLCQKWKVDFVPESLINVYVNYGKKRMSSVGFYSDYQKRTIQFHTYFLNSFSEVFKRYPDRAWYHYLELSSAYFYIGETKKSNEFFRKYISIKGINGNVLLPIKWRIKKLLKK